jgi:Ca2+-binding RTX toxin-like protein
MTPEAAANRAPNGGTLANVQAGQVAFTTLEGRGTLIIDNQGDDRRRDVTFYGYGWLTGLSPASIGWSVTNATFYGGGGGNTYHLNDQIAFIGFELYAGSGSDTIHLNDLEAYPYWYHDVRIHGQGGDDTLTIDDRSATRAATYTVYADSLTRGNRNPAFPWDSIVTVGFDGLENLAINAGGGNDVISARGMTSGPRLLFDGGRGDDRLEGSAGADVLVGGEGEDILEAGAGRNLLIGGAGSDRLLGGTGDDLLIGGTTTHDDDLGALSAIMDEWGSADSYALRVAKLTGANGLLGDDRVWDDLAANVLTGASGQDLFFLGVMDSSDATSTETVRRAKKKP